MPYPIKKNAMATKQVPLLIILVPLFFVLSWMDIAPFAATAKENAGDALLPTYHLLLSKHTNRKIFIIGASTVRYDNNLPGDQLQSGKYQYPRVGWGAELYKYMCIPADVFNQARRGADSISFQIEPPPADDPDYKGPGWWGATREMIKNTPVAERGFLLIQFGANDLFHHVSEDDFKANLHFYRDQAFELGLTPVFITPVDSRSQGDNRRPYPEYMKAVANENLQPPYQNRKVMLLDLHQRSLDQFGSRSTTNLGYAFGNVPYLTWSGSFQRMDTTHFEQRGAMRVAGWVRDLACELSDQSLCNIFKKNFTLTPPTIYFTGEYIDDPNDPEINGWSIADNNGVLNSDETDNLSISKDNVRQDRVLVFNTYSGDGTHFLVHGFHLANDTRSWANQNQKHIAWNALFTSGDFRIYVEVTTTDGLRHLTYKPLDIDQGSGETYPEYIRFGLGADANDGTWKTIQRNLEADLKKFEPDNNLIQVNGIRIKGTGRLDNLLMF